MYRCCILFDSFTESPVGLFPTYAHHHLVSSISRPDHREHLSIEASILLPNALHCAVTETDGICRPFRRCHSRFSRITATSTAAVSSCILRFIRCSSFFSLKWSDAISWGDELQYASVIPFLLLLPTCCFQFSRLADRFAAALRRSFWRNFNSLAFGISSCRSSTAPTVAADSDVFLLQGIYFH